MSTQIKINGLAHLINRVTDELVTARSRQVRFPSKYIKDIENGLGVADNRTGRPDLPQGLQVPTKTLKIEGEKETNCQIESAMAAAISEAEGMDPVTLEEAM